MAFILQATTTLEDPYLMREALEWLSKDVGHAEGIIELRVFQDVADPARITIIEEWESQEAFGNSFETYSMEQRSEFLSRMGLTPESFERAMGVSTGSEVR